MLSEISLASFAHVGIPLVKRIHYLPETRIANVLSVRMERVKTKPSLNRYFASVQLLFRVSLQKTDSLSYQQNKTIPDTSWRIMDCSACSGS